MGCTLWKFRFVIFLIIGNEINTTISMPLPTSRLRRTTSEETSEVVYYENKVIQRSGEIMRMNTYQLTKFCSETFRFLHLYRTDQNILQQLLNDVTVCLFLKERHGYSFDYTRYSTTPFIIPSGELIFLRGGRQERTSILQQLQSPSLKRHCKKVFELIDKYNQAWMIRGQLSRDAHSCDTLGVSRADIEKIENDILSELYEYSNGNGALVLPHPLNQTHDSEIIARFPQNVMVDRSEMLNMASREEIRHHCALAAQSLRHYKNQWNNREQILMDLHSCLPTYANESLRITGLVVQSDINSTADNIQIEKFTPVQLAAVKILFSDSNMERRHHDIRRLGYNDLSGYCSVVDAMLKVYDEEWGVLEFLKKDKALCQHLLQFPVSYSENDSSEEDDGTPVCLFLCPFTAIVLVASFLVGIVAPTSILITASVSNILRKMKSRVPTRLTTPHPHRTDKPSTTEKSITSTSTTEISTTPEQSTTTEPPDTDVCFFEPRVPQRDEYDEDDVNMGEGNQTLSINQRNRFARSPAVNTIVYPKSPFGECRLLFNEFSTDNPGADLAEFLEYRKMCPDGGRLKASNSLHGFITLILNGQSEEILTVINHQEGKLSKRGGQFLYVVGSVESDMVDTRLDGPFVQHISDANRNYILNGREHPNAMILLHSTDRHKQLKMFSLPGLKWVGGQKVRDLSKDIGPLKLTTDLIAYIKAHVQDMVVYGEKPATDRCDIFEQIWPELKDMTPEYVVRDWEPANENLDDYSANRCVTHARPISPHAFKIGKVSLGLPNNCDELIPFLISKRLIELGATISGQESRVQQSCTSQQATSSTYASISVDRYRGAVDVEMSEVVRECRTGANPEINGQQMEKLFELNRLKMLVKTFETTRIYPWLNTGRFDPEMREFLQNFLNDVLDVNMLLADNITPWLQVNPDYVDPTNSTLTCVFCVLFRDNKNRYDRPSSNIITAIMTEEGYRINTGTRSRKINKNYILAHLQNRLHLDATNFLMEEVGVRVLKQLNDALLEQVPAQQRHWISTKNFFEQVVQYTKLNIPIQSMPKLMEQQVKYGAPLGVLYRNSKGMTNVITEVGIVNHELTLYDLIKQDRPMSLVLDGTTISATGVHYVMFYFQTLDRSNPVLYHYRLRPLGADLSGLAHFKLLMESLEVESFPMDEFVKRNLISVTTDGASAMSSTFIKFIREWTNRPIIHVWCLAHKMNLGLEHAQNQPELTEFDGVIKIVNNLHSYFTTSPKRGAALKERGRREGYRVRNIPLIIKVRWVATQYHGLSVLLEMWEVIVKELQHLVSTAKGKSLIKAKELLEQMTTTNFVSSLAFLIDATNHLTAVNGILQKAGTLVITNVKIRNRLLYAARRLKNNNGPALEAMLAASNCEGADSCNLHLFETAESVTYLGVKLAHKPTQMLRDMRQPFLNKLLQQFNHYFPVDLFEKYFIFTPSLFEIPRRTTQPNPDTTEDNDDGFLVTGSSPVFATAAIRYFAEDLKWFTDADSKLLYPDWVDLVSSIVMDPMFLDLRDTAPEIFWPAALDNPLYRWTSRTRKLVDNVLTIAATSVEPERCFSDLGWIIGSRRSGLDSSILDHFMRIRYNIPHDLDKWNIMDYIMSWLDQGHCLVDDKTCVTTHKDITDDDPNFIQRSTIGVRIVNRVDLESRKRKNTEEQ